MDEIDLTPVSDGLTAANKTAGKINDSVKNINTTLTKASASNVEGLDLIAEKQEEVNNQLNSLGQISDLIAQVLNGVNNIYGIAVKYTEDGGVEAEVVEKEPEAPEDEEEEEFTYEVDDSITEASALSGLPNMPSLVSSGFGLLVNTLRTMQDALIGSFSELTNAFIQSQQTLTKETPKEDAGIKSESKLKGFLESMAGPLESVASGILMLSLAVTAVALLPIDASLIAKISMITLTLGALFLGIRELTTMANEYRDDIDPNNENSLTARVKDLAIVFGIITATFVGMVVMVKYLSDNIGTLALGLALTAGIMVITIGTLKALATQADESKDTVGPEGPISTFVNGLGQLVATIAITMTLAGFLWEPILRGFIPTMLIIGFAGVMLREVLRMSSEFEGSEEKIEGVSSVIKQFTTLIGVMAGITLILGLIPVDILLKGFISFGVLILLTDFMIDSLFKSADEVDGKDDKIKQLSTFLNSVSIFLALETAIVLVLGNVPIGTLIQGFASITLMFLSIWALSKMISKIEIDAKAFLTMAALTAFSLLVGGTMFVIAGMFSLIPGGAEEVMKSALALVIAVAAFALIGAAMIGLAYLATYVVVAFLPAMAALGVISLAAMTIALTSAGITAAWKGLGIEPTEVMLVGSALMVISLAFVTMAASIIALAALAIPLLATAGLALISINVLKEFAQELVIACQGFNDLNLDGVEIEQLAKLGAIMGELALLSVGLIASASVLVLTLAGLSVLTGILSLQLAGAVISLTMVSGQLYLLSLIRVPEEFDNLKSITEAMQSVNEAVEVIKGIDTISLDKQLKLKSTLNFINDLPKRMQFKSADTLATEQLKEFAASVKELASAGDGLEGLAKHLGEVLKATSDLQKSNNINIKASAETISKMNTSFENFGSMKLETESVELKSTNKIMEKLNDLIDLMKQNVQATKTVAVFGAEQVNQTILSKQVGSGEEMESKF